VLSDAQQQQILGREAMDNRPPALDICPIVRAGI